MSRDVLLSLQAEARSFQSSMAAASASLRSFSGELRTTSRAAAALGPATAQGTSALGRLSSTVTAVSSAVTAAGVALGLLGSAASSSLAALQGVVEGTVGQFAEFDAGIRSVAAAMSATDVKKLSNDITQLGIQSEFTIGAVQQGALALAQLGATEATLRPLLDTAIKIAGVTKTDLATAAEIAKKQMNSFGLSIAELPKLSTLLIQASTKSAATMERLGQALQFAGPAAAGVGQSLRDVVPVIEALSDAGLDASIAGTTIRSAFTELLDPTREAKAAIESLGLTVEDLSPTSNKLIDIVDQLGDAHLDAAAAVNIFGKRFGLNILKLTQMSREGLTGAAALRVYQRELDNTAEAEGKVAQIRAGLDFSLKQVKASLEVARTIVGAFAVELFGLDKSADAAAKRLSGLVGALAELSAPEFREIVVKLIGQEDLEAIFERAANRLGPPLFAVTGAAMTFGARQLLGYAPLIGANLAKAMIVGIASLLPRVVTGAGALLTDLLAAGVVVVVQLAAGHVKRLITELEKAGNALSEKLHLGKLFDFSAATQGLDRISDSMQAGLVGAADAVTAKLSGLGAGLGKDLAREAGRFEIGSPRELREAGRRLASDIFGQSGTFKGLIDAGKVAGGEFAAAAQDGLAAVTRLTGRGAIRAVQISENVPTSFAPLMGALAALKLNDFSHRPTPVQQQMLYQMRQQQQAEARVAAEQARARADEDRRRADRDRAASSAAAINGLTADGIRGGAPTIIYDRRNQTIYGAKAREAVVGPIELTPSDSQRTGLGAWRMR